MAKVDVLQLVTDFSRGQADVTTVERYYRDIVYLLGRRALLTQASLVASSPGATSYAMPSSAIDLMAVFYDATQLFPASRRELEWENQNWRDEEGPPQAYITEGETERTIRPYPKPVISSKDFIFLFGSPFGKDFPAYSISMIHTETRTDVPVWLELPLALFILGAEFKRESAHKDPDFSQACELVANSLLEMVL